MLARCAFYFSFIMKLDPKVTQAVQDWLNTPGPDRDIKAGAALMLSLNRNRALYNSILKRPDKFLPKLIYELKKHLKIRLDDMTVSDVVRMESTVLPRVESTLTEFPVITPDDELPEGKIAKGKRPDHDSLPAEIQELWNSNAQTYQKMMLLFNECKAESYSGAQPCDIYVKLSVLDKAEKKYRENLARYDSYILNPDPAGAETNEPIDGNDINTDNEKTINNARKTLSKYRSRLAELPEDDPKREEALRKIQDAVSAILACGAGVAPDTQEELTPLGIKFELD